MLKEDKWQCFLMRTSSTTEKYGFSLHSGEQKISTFKGRDEKELPGGVDALEAEVRGSEAESKFPLLKCK